MPSSCRRRSRSPPKLEPAASSGTNNIRGRQNVNVGRPTPSSSTTPPPPPPLSSSSKKKGSMFPQLSAFFADLKLGIIKSSVSSGGANGAGSGRKGSQRRRPTADGDSDDARAEDLDDSKAMVGYGCLGRRSTSMENGLSGSASKRRRRTKRSSRHRGRTGGSAQSLDHLSDRVYRSVGDR